MFEEISFVGGLEDCPPWIPDLTCEFVGMKTNKQKAAEENKSLDSYYPVVILNDGNYTNFLNLTKVASIAGENTAGYSSYNGKGKPIKNFPKGSSFGVAEVYYQGSDNLWIGFKKDGKTHNWVYIKENTINATKLYEKGVKTDKETTKANAEADKPFGDKFLETVQTGFKYVAIAGGVYILSNAFLNSEERKITRKAIGKVKKRAKTTPKKYKKR